MKNIKKFIESGIIESYVLGSASAEEIAEVEQLASENLDVQKAIDDFAQSLEQEAMANAVTPDPLVKPMVMATVDFISRLESGETPLTPPMLTRESTIADFEPWLSRPDMVLPEKPANIYAKLLAHSPEATTAIVWIKDLAPKEVHHDELERFLIVEGSCTIYIGEESHPLTAGDFLSIPLHVKHKVVVTSDIACKAIMQRVAV